MTSQQSGSVKWHQITVVIRSDILDAARTRGIDISSECNRALAARTGIDFSQQKIPEPAENPVIIAKEGTEGIRGLQAGSGRKRIHPVLNAEDPSARDHLMKMKKDRPVQEQPTPPQLAAGKPGEPVEALPRRKNLCRLRYREPAVTERRRGWHRRQKRPGKMT